MKERVRKATDTILDASPRRVGKAVADKVSDLGSGIARQRRVLLLRKYLKRIKSDQDKVQAILEQDPELMEEFAKQMQEEMAEALRTFGIGL